MLPHRDLSCYVRAERIVARLARGVRRARKLRKMAAACCDVLRTLLSCAFLQDTLAAHILHGFFMCGLIGGRSPTLAPCIKKIWNLDDGWMSHDRLGVQAPEGSGSLFLLHWGIFSWLFTPSCCSPFSMMLRLALQRTACTSPLAWA